MRQKIRFEIIRWQTNHSVPSDSPLYYRNLVVRIVEQTEIGPQFGRGGNFTASNGYKLSSEAYPEYYSSQKILCVRGTETNQNDREIIIPTYEEYSKLSDAISEFNNTFYYGQPTPKKCRGTCGSVMCADCLKDLKNNITFTFTGERSAA